MLRRYAGLVTLGLATIVATSGCTTRRRAAPPPRQAPPPGYAQQGPGQAPPPAAGQPQWPWLAFRLPPPIPAPGILRPVNVSALMGSMSRSPCRPQEMSPGNWIGFDCSPPSFIMGALPFRRTQQFTSSTGSVPGTVDHRTNGMEGPVKNQGAVGTCTAVSLSTAMENALRKMRHTQNVSALHLWSNYRVPSMGTAGSSNTNKRIATDSTWPYDPAQACKMMERSYDSCGSAYDVQPNSADSDPAIKSSKSRADGAGVYTLIGVEKLSSHNPSELATIIAGGDDLWVAFNMDMEAWKTRNMKNNVIQDYVPTSNTGHAVVLSGFRTVGSQKQFLIHNSWGTGWGEGGYAWIGENMVRSQLRYAYRVNVGQPGAPGASGPATPPSNMCPNGAPKIGGLCLPSIPGMGPPKPQPAPGGNQSSGCAAGQTKDMLSGQCINACPNGAAPVGGLCLPQVQPR